MSSLTDLKELISILTDREMRDLYNRVGRKKDMENTTTFQLIKILEDYVDVSSEEIQNKLYHKINEVAFKKLVGRSIDKVYDILLVTDNLKAVEVYESNASRVFQLQLDMIISQVLRFRGLFNLSNKIMIRVIESSRLYEHYDILIHALEKYIIWKITTLEGKDIEGIRKDLEKYIESNRLRMLAMDLYKESLPINIDEKDEFTLRYWRNNLLKIIRVNKRLKSKTVELYINYIWINICSLLKDYKGTLKYIERNIKHLEDSKMIYTKNRMSYLLINKAEYNAYLFNFEIAVNSLEECRKNMIKVDMSDMVYYEKCMFLYLYYGKSEKIKYYAGILHNRIKALKNKQQYNIEIYYYLAIYYYLVSAIDNAIKIYAIIWKDAGRVKLNIEIKILSIFLYYEKGLLELIENVVINLKRYVYRSKVGDGYGIRVNLILSIMTGLIVEGFDFIKVAKRFRKELDRLKVLSSKFDMASYEIIIFHEWFEAKAKGMAYDHEAAMKRLKRANKVRS